MQFPLKYKCLQNEVYTDSVYALKAIRFDDKDKIRQWRNDQIDILRQKEILTSAQQDHYFSTQVFPLFFEENPKQVLFSFFENGVLIGYGGLVHINLSDKNAEISFLLYTKRNSVSDYLELFGYYLVLIQKVAVDLGLHKIFSYGYDLEKYRFEPLVKSNYHHEALLKDHVKIKGIFYDVKIYAKIL